MSCTTKTYITIFCLTNIDKRGSSALLQDSIVKELKPTVHDKRRTFTEWILGAQWQDADFTYRIIFSDETHFYLLSYINKQNCRIWENESPRETQEKEMHPGILTVCCGFCACDVIGPIFFKNENDIHLVWMLNIIGIR